ncbi:MAG: phospholipase D family protein [Deltaproteobacteria bacterium]|nr:phospholipase D family protein [Deltaproteobacteria bacterium]MCL5277944.1 phospholipase D family protein [Deltaproteobacteria bacterium]
MTTTFLQSELWYQIGSLAKKAKRKHIAVAYLGSGASKLIPLGKGDTLVLDMSFQAVKAGQTNPYEVGKYLKAGVQVFNCANLHAKVYIFDRSAIISSSNLSNHSQETLVEAGIATNDPAVLKTAREFVKTIQVEIITPEYLKQCKQVYNPPRFEYGHLHKQKTKKIHPTYSKLWIIGLSDADFSEQENLISEQESRKALREVKDSHKHEIGVFRLIGAPHFSSFARKGDLVVQLYKSKAYPPARIIRIAKYRLPHRKQKRLLIFVEDEKKPKLFSWSKFKKNLSGFGLTRLAQKSVREIKSAAASHAILGMWN